MKKLLLLFFVMLAGLQLKAQQFSGKQHLLPMDTNTVLLKIDSNMLLKGSHLDLPKLQNLNSNKQLLSQLKPFAGGTRFYSQMPVWKPAMQNYNMPVARLGKPGEKYPMMIKKYQLVNPAKPGDSTILTTP